MPPTARAPDPGVDPARVLKNAAASAVALGSCFGTMTALNNAVRAQPGMSPAIKILTGLLPSASVFPTPWVEDGMRRALGTTATYPVAPTLAHDAVAGAALFLFNTACARSRSVPKFSAHSRAGAAATVLQTTVATLFAGAASEATAQWMNHHERGRPDAPSEPPPLDNTSKAIGRTLSQVPAASLQTGLAFMTEALPKTWSLLPMGVVTGGWCLRRVAAVCVQSAYPPQTTAASPRAPGPPEPIILLTIPPA